MRWREGYSADGLARGEARLGRFDVQRELGLTAKEYRLACDTLEEGKFVALQRTHHGTVARIVDSRVFSPTAPTEGTPKGTGKDTPRAHEGHTEGHKEEGKKVNDEVSTLTARAEAAIPTWDEVKALASMRAVPEASAKSFFDHHEGNQLWVNQFGKLINWQHKLTSWAASDRQNPKANGTKPTGPMCQPHELKLKRMAI